MPSRPDDRATSRVVMSRLVLSSALLLAVLAGAVAAVEAPPRQPVNDELYKVYSGFYDYDAKAPLNAEVKSEDVEGVKVDTIHFDSTNGERVPGLMMVPPGTGRRPLVLILHGYGMDKEMLRPAAGMLGQVGLPYAFLALDAQYHGERKKPGEDVFGGDLIKAQKAMIQTVVDYRRAIDYAATRADVDTTRVAVVGLSMGAMMGTLLTAVEPRIKTSALIVGGADWETLVTQSRLAQLKQVGGANVDWNQARRTLDSVDPLNFAPHFGDRPVLLINARQDDVIPEASAKRLHDVAVGKPLEKEWVESGHMVPVDLVLPRLVLWLAQRL